MLVRCLKIAGGALALWLLALWTAVAVADELPSLFLTVVWHEREDGWTGTWSPNTPSARDGRYRALWRKGSERASADLIITISGPGPESLGTHDVRVVRTSHGRRCRYGGFLNPTRPITGEWQVVGNYLCEDGPLLPWSARLEGLPAFPLIPGTPTVDERLTKRWRERERDWIGEWVPRSLLKVNGEYEGHWRKGNGEQESAFLQITIVGDRVSVIRTGPRGRCDYIGEFSDRRTVAGQYLCAWDSQRRLWSATIDE